MYDIFLLVKDGDNYIDLTERFPNIKVITTENRQLNEEVLSTILKKAYTNHFFVINNPHIELINFNFKIKVPEYDEKFVISWNDNVIRLFNRKLVKKNVTTFIDTAAECPYKLMKDDILVVDNSTVKYDIFIVTDDERKADYFKKSFPHAQVIEREHLRVNFKLLTVIMRMAKTRIFYLVLDPFIDMVDFDFTFCPPLWDLGFMHIWNNDYTVRMFSTDIMKSAMLRYTDNKLAAGKTKLKNIDKEIYDARRYDVVFISYDEPFANANFERLKERIPYIKRVNGVKGIFEAHKMAFDIAESPMVYIVDADAIVTDDFDFAFKPEEENKSRIHVWRSMNPINDLSYGYGGVKLFPTFLLRECEDWCIDFTTTIGDGLIVKEEVSNITAFNSDEYSTWRSAFRECAKLSAKIIPGQDTDPDTAERLDVWCTVGSDREFGEYAISGAINGREFGDANKDNQETMNLINDFNWLKERFLNDYGN